MKATKVLNFFQTSTKNLYWSSLIAFVLALFSFTTWHQVFTFHNLPIQIRMAAPGAEYVRVYWDDPEQYSTAYERIAVKPVASQTNTSDSFKTLYHRSCIELVFWSLFKLPLAFEPTAN